MDPKHLIQRITSTNGIDIRDSAHVRAALAEADALRRERDDLAARLAKVEQAEPVAWVPMHPRFGALCASRQEELKARPYATTPSSDW